MRDKIFIYTDGGSRGNPGPAALGVVFKNANGDIIKSYGEFLGTRTNNEAEYSAVIFALKKLKQVYGKEKLKKIDVEVRMDSELVCKQLNGEYKIENEKLHPLFITIWNLRVELGDIVFTHVPRERNRDADRMVNEALDNPKQAVLL